MARLDQAVDRFADEDGAEGQAAAERLGEGDDVRDDAALLEGEERGGAPEAALDLVEDQDGAGAVGELPCGGEELVCERDDAALAHDRLEDDGARVAVD